MIGLCQNHYLTAILDGGDPNADIFKKVKGIGKIYEVDLQYPSELHHLHNDYPCAAQKIKVTDDMLSDYCKKIKNDYKISSGNVHKLIPTLYDKEKYVLHEENLKLYMRLGLKLKKCIEFYYSMKNHG